MGAARKLAMFDPDDDAGGGSPPLRSDHATIAQICDWYVALCRGKQQKDVEIERGRIYRRFVAAYGKLKCVDARPHNLLAFIEANLVGRSAWTIRRWNATIQRAFNAAARMGLILANPFKGLAFPQGEDGRDWTNQEYQVVLRSVAPHLRRFLVFMRFSGMRSIEVRNLLWSDIKPEIESIIIIKHKTSAKTRKPRRIPFNRVLIKLLLWQREHVPQASNHVFLNAMGNPWSLRALNKGFCRARAIGGIAKNVRMHGVRHTFATHAIMNGLDVATVAQLLGHTDIKTTQRYLHLAGKDEHLNEAMQQAISGEPNRKTKGGRLEL